MPINFVSRALQGLEINYAPTEKLILALTFELEEHDIHYRPRTSIKEQILVDFIVERPKDNPQDTPMEDEEALLDPCIQFTDGSSCIDGFGADEREVLAVVEEEGRTWMTPIYEYLKEEILPEEKRKIRAICRKAGRYVVINGILYKRSFLGPWLQCVGPLQANYILREINEGSCSMHAGPRYVVVKALRSGYYWPTMHIDARFGLPGEIISDNEKHFRDNPFKDRWESYVSANASLSLSIHKPMAWWKGQTGV
ncbi:hypothetical protein Tco_1353539 [Tanacetum coccineum]